MSVKHPQKLQCGACHTEWTELIFTSLHLSRLPEAQAAIRDGTIGLIRCPGCGQTTRALGPTCYTDFHAGHYIVLLPGGESAWARHAEEQQAVFDEVFTLGPPIAEQLAESLLCRIVFSVRALREKVIAWDHGLDDRLVEVLKRRLAEEERIDPTQSELRLIGVLDAGQLLLFGRHEVGEAGADLLVNTTVATREELDVLCSQPQLAREECPAAFHPWVVDWTVQARHPAGRGTRRAAKGG